jgi:hypothetical protein
MPTYKNVNNKPRQFVTGEYINPGETIVSDQYHNEVILMSFFDVDTDEPLVSPIVLSDNQEDLDEDIEYDVPWVSDTALTLTFWLESGKGTLYFNSKDTPPLYFDHSKKEYVLQCLVRKFFRKIIIEPDTDNPMTFMFTLHREPF